MRLAATIFRRSPAGRAAANEASPADLFDPLLELDLNDMAYANESRYMKSNVVAILNYGNDCRPSIAHDLNI